MRVENYILDYKISNITKITAHDFYNSALNRLKTITNNRTIDELYINDYINIYENKLKISSVLVVKKYINEDLIIIETKNEYYAIKYNGNFICLKKSETEYGLVTGEYQLLAIHMSILKEVTQKKIPKFNNICKIFNWKLTNKAKEELSYKYLTKI